MTTVLQVADSVTAQLNAAEFDFEFVAERLYVPNFDLEDMKELRVSVVPRRVNPATVRVNRKASRKASRKANQAVNRDQRASHRAAMVQKVDPVAIDQVTAKVKAIAFPGRPAIPPADLAAIRRAALEADQRAAQAVIHRHRQAIRMILRQVTPMIHPPASRIVRA